MTEEYARALEANNLLARLQGNTVTDSYEEEVVEFEFKKKKTKAKASEHVIVRQNTIPDLDIFKALHRDEKITVQQMGHNIHYKEQIWFIPDRQITYSLELINNMKIAKDTAVMFKCTSPEDLRQAECGEVRYMKIVSYENIPYRSKEIGYLRIESDNGVLRAKTLLKVAQMKENNINPEKVKQQINKIMDKLLGKLDGE